MKIKRMVLHTPQKEFELHTDKQDLSQEQFEEAKNVWGRLLEGKLDGVTIGHLCLPLVDDSTIILPKNVLTNSFMTMEIYND